MIFQNFGFNRIIPTAVAPAPAGDPYLKLWVDAGDTDSYTSGSTTIYDLSGTGNDLTVSGTISFESATGSWGFDNNTANYLGSTTMISMSAGTGSQSYEIWQRYTGDTNNNYYVVYEHGGNSEAGQNARLIWPDFGFGYAATNAYGTNEGGYYVPAIGTNTTYTKGNSANKWLQVVLVRDGDTAYQYVNGALNDSRTGFSARELTSTSNIKLGANITPSLGPFLGDIAIFKAWTDKALSANEVSESWEANKARFGL